MSKYMNTRTLIHSTWENKNKLCNGNVQQACWSFLRIYSAWPILNQYSTNIEGQTFTPHWSSNVTYVYKPTGCFTIMPNLLNPIFIDFQNISCCDLLHDKCSAYCVYLIWYIYGTILMGMCTLYSVLNELNI